MSSHSVQLSQAIPHSPVQEESKPESGLREKIEVFRNRIISFEAQIKSLKDNNDKVDLNRRLGDLSNKTNKLEAKYQIFDPSKGCYNYGRTPDGLDLTERSKALQSVDINKLQDQMDRDLEEIELNFTSSKAQESKAKESSVGIFERIAAIGLAFRRMTSRGQTFTGSGPAQAKEI